MMVKNPVKAVDPKSFNERKEIATLLLDSFLVLGLNPHSRVPNCKNYNTKL